MTVLDLTQVMAGPFCTMVLADLGADVIKVENPTDGDQTRRSWGTSGRGEDSRAFLSLNRNKRSITLDLKTQPGRDAFYRLVRTADVVIENWRPGVAERLGLDFETLSAINPRLVVASISGFGKTGPYATRPGYDLIAQAMAGVMSITGEPGGRPVKSGLPVADLGAGLFCAVGILAAWSSSKETGQGQYLETSLFESTLALSVWESTEFWTTGTAPLALGSANRMSAPYQALATQDGYVTVGANNDRLWNRLCECIELTRLLTDERFIDNPRRMANRVALVAELEAVFTGRTTADWVEILLGAGIPAGPIQNYQQVLEEDPHVKERDMIKFLDHPVEGRIEVIGSPIRLSRTPPSIRRHPPLLGEHNDEVLGT
jgi:crotonobetainyl-CoA:carnitine CoA-transferase CaiB-like acyl-CoA transferase